MRERGSWRQKEETAGLSEQHSAHWQPDHWSHVHDHWCQATLSVRKKLGLLENWCPATFTEWGYTFDSLRTWWPLYPACRNPWVNAVTLFKQSTLPRNKNMSWVVFRAGWELHFLMELPFGWIWQEPILTNTGNEGTFTLFPSVFSFLPNYRIQNFWWY